MLTKEEYEKHKTLYSVICILVVSIVLFYFLYRNSEREKAINGVITKGLVYDNFYYSKGQSGLRYSFFVKNKMYKSSSIFTRAKKISLGDSIYISYELENPENSIPVFDSLHLNSDY